MLRLRRKAGQRLDDAQAFERDRERAFRQAERELRQFGRNFVQAIEARAATLRGKCDTAGSSRTSSLIQQFRVAVRA
jgi:hypothetical protein